jgi:hypothetical protein
MLLVSPDNDRDRRECLVQRFFILFFEGAERFDAVCEMDDFDAEFRECPDALEQFVRAGQGRASRAVNDSDQIELSISGIFRKGPPALTYIRKAAY